MLLLEQARLAIQQGDRAKAIAILANLVKSEPQNSDAWLLLAEVLDNPEQASYCRERARLILKNQALQNVAPNLVKIHPAEPIYDHNKKAQEKCPFCAELIPFDARICPYCGRNLANQPELSTSPSQRLEPRPVQPQVAKNTSSYGRNILLAGVLSILVVCGCLLLAAVFQGASTYNVRYEITGSTSAATITWMNSQGGIEQGDFRLPFQKSFSFDGGGYASLTAQNYYDSGSITCQIWVNDVLWRESNSSGAYSIALCNGILGES